MKWLPIHMAFSDPGIMAGDRSILVCDNRVLDGHQMVLYWDADAPMTKLGQYGWTSQEADSRFHTDTFTHYMELPSPPKNEFWS